MKKRFYITTPIYYPSARLHIGHAYCTVLTDIFARYKRFRGFECYFLTGADEHGEKIQKNAEKAGVSPQEFVDEIVKGFHKLWDLLYISNNDFIRTTEERHWKTVQDIFTKLYNNGDIYLGKYKGWYCTPCESFWTDTQVGPDHLCPECGRPVQVAEEEAYFFKTSKYVDRLLKFYDDNPNFLTPESRKNEMINTFIKPGLDDLCVSRTSFSWGVPIKENPRHVVYVWLDALTNYITALGYNTENDELFQKFWQDEESETIHILGADITRFHAIYWPMFLMALGLRLPDREFIHGLLMMKDSKMSKSKGNVVDPYPMVERYGVDALRYYLAREVNFGNDGNFSPEQFVERINVDLANALGNLLNRTVSMVNKYYDGVIPAYTGRVNDVDGNLEDLTKITINNYEKLMDDLKITEAIAAVNELVNKSNKYIDETEPWNLAKDPNKKENLASVMLHLTNSLYVAGMLLKPILVTASDKLFEQIGISGDLLNYESIYNYGKTAGLKVEKKDQLFPRLDGAIEIEFIQAMMNGK
ncbi:MAG: methionine--tRNA ligase [Erysipelotrichaceae bacterium]|jgi:methionyl-tRNA synthetase|nr:methionine--tRNA ligase [Erysipelotrichaceae bacterium]